MGLMQKALETYDSHLDYATQNRTDSALMAPVGHIVTRADLEITLDPDGRFVDASAVDKSEPKIVIPATEGSAGRTSAPCPHPLCEQIGYLIPENETKYQLYVDQLAAWEASAHTHPKLKAVLAYIHGRTLLSDLLRCGLVKLDADGKPENEKLLVRWRILGEGTEACWLDQTLFDAFTGYSIACHSGKTMMCMVSGAMTTIAEQHPKGIIPINGNAKLISANDSSGFTYRGRFSEEWQAAGIGYQASQKAHSALRWLVQDQGVILGARTFLCWNPQGRKVAMPMNPLMRLQKPTFQPTQYRDELKKTLEGKKAELKVTDGVVIAAFDAATTGRLSLTYYNELQGHDFLERLYDWDNTCCWPHRYFGIESPTLRQIVNYAFGNQRSEKNATKMETDDRVFRQQMQRLIACRVERAPIGADIVKALVNRASRLETYATRDSGAGQQEDIRETLLFTACAVIRKYRYDRFEEEWSMALEPERKDRSYQFGRLLAVMEKVERDTYETSEGREPNAIRMQSIFCQRPMYAANQLEKQLERAYFPRLKPGSRIWYKNLIGQIMENISAFPNEDWNKPLEDSYLMGYYLQRSALYTRKNNDETEEDEQ